LRGQREHAALRCAGAGARPGGRGTPRPLHHRGPNASLAASHRDGVDDCQLSTEQAAQARRPASDHNVCVAQVHGIPFEGRDAAEAAALTRKVLMLSKIFVFLAIVTAIQDLSAGRRTDSFGWLLLSLAMPYCGYYGAKNRDRNMLCMFYSVNLVISVMYILWILLMLMILSMVPSAIKACDDCHSLVRGAPEYTAHCATCMHSHMQCGPEPDAATHHHLTGTVESEESLETEEVEGHQQQSACDAWENLDSNRGMVYIQMLICLIQIVLAVSRAHFISCAL
jgi:hypothetical protein